MLTSQGKEHFLHQLETIVESVRQNRVRTERRQQEEKSKRDLLNIQLAQLVDKARQYAKVLKDLQEVRSMRAVDTSEPSLLSSPFERTSFSRRNSHEQFCQAETESILSRVLSIPRIKNL